MTVVSLREQWLHAAVELDAASAAALHGSRAVSLSPVAGRADCWDIRTAQYVGVVHAGDVEIRIRPKVPVGNLLFLLGYARDPSGWQDSDLDVEANLDVVAALATALAHYAEGALAHGVLQGYRREEDALMTLRGRLRESDQLRRRFGFPIPVEVAWDEYTVDIAENQLLRSAGRLLLLLGGLPERVRARLVRLVRRLEGVTELHRGQALPKVRFTRLNNHYRQGVNVAELVLTNRSTDLTVGKRAGVSFLFDMNKVFEEFLGAALAKALATHGGVVTEQHRDTLDHDGAIAIKPDVTWWSGAHCRAAVDAKYKSIAISEMPNADVYQMLAYCLALRTSPGWLVYAAGNETPAVHQIRNANIDVHVVALDLSQRPAGLLDAVRALADKIALGSSSLDQMRPLTAAFTK